MCIRDRLKLAGIFITGGESKAAIMDGLVKVNGEPCLMRGKKLRNGDTVEFEGKVLEITDDSTQP